MRRIAWIAPFAAAALITGCGSSSSSTSSASGSSAPAASSTTSSTSSTTAPASAKAAGGNLTLDETEFKITPAKPTVTSTGTITVTARNTGKITHALAVQTPSGVVHTGAIAAGATATLKVDLAKAGSYTFYCPIPGHRQAGMVGTLIVAGGGAAASGGTSTGSGTSSTSTGGRSAY